MKLHYSFSFSATLFMFCILNSAFLFAESIEQYPQFKFKSITIDNGLANNRTTGATKDSRGFVWFATDDGICRFDGLSVRNYNTYLGHNDEEFDQQFTAIYTDKSGNLLAGAYRLFQFNYEIEKLEMVFDENEKNQPNRIRVITEDEENTIWLGARNGVFSMDTKFNIKHLPPDTNEIQYEVWDLVKTDSKIWIGTRSNGIMVYNLTDSTYTKVPLLNELGLSVKVILCLFNNNGVVWVGTKDNGIFKIDSETNQVIAHEFPDINVRRIRDISKDKKNNLWIGTMEGLYLISAGTNQYYRYAHQYHPISEITHNSVFNVFIDNNEVLWLSTYAGGINYTDLNKKPITHIAAQENDNNFLNNSIVSGFCVDKKNNVYIGTDHGGLNYWDRQSQKFTYYLQAPGLVSGTNIKCMVSDSLGNIWIGTYEGGISCFIPSLKKFKYYFSNPEDKNSLQSNIVYSLAIDKNQNLWIGTNKGVDFLDTKKGVITRKYSSNNIHVVYIDDFNKLWVGIEGIDLFCYDVEENIFIKCFDFRLSSTKTLLRDSENHLWIGEKDGVSVVDLNTNQIYRYDKSQGLSSNIVFGIIEDDSKNIWVSSSSGLMKLVGAAISPDNFEIKIYTIEDGLQSNQFWRNSAYKSKKGELFFGGVNGFNCFYPNEIGENQNPPKMVFVYLKILNKIVLINQEINGQIVLDKSLNEKKELVLNYEQKIFTLEFVALHFANAEKNKYKYMLYPFEDEWNFTEYPRNSATYTSLPAGNYVFKLKGANSDGIWQDDVLELRIRITPPIWKTWWFITLLIISLIMGILMLFHIRLNRIRKQKIILEKLVEQRTAEIEKQNLTLKGLNNLKDKLFSVVAHDLKNPFQSILGFSDLLRINYERYPEDQKKKFINLINDSAHKFYELLENLLAWARTQTGAMPYKPKVMNVSSLILRVVGLHEHKLNTKQIKIANKINTPIIVFIDEQMIYSVLNNLITNAIKFTEEKGQIIIDYKKQQDKFIISISDDGMGMTNDEVDNLFLIGQVSSITGTSGEQGTGLGLLICKEFVEKNKGEIWVRSIPNEGSTFFFTLPIYNE